MDFQIVPMERSHLDQVEALERLCFPEDPWSRQIFEEALADSAAVNLAAVGPEGAVLGYVNCTIILDEGDVGNVAVHPDCRRQGAASALLVAFRRIGEKRGLDHIMLMVRVSNAPARALYARHGYVDVGLRKNYYLHPREDAIYMRLELRNDKQNSDTGRTGTNF